MFRLGGQDVASFGRLQKLRSQHDVVSAEQQSTVLISVQIEIGAGAWILIEDEVCTIVLTMTVVVQSHKGRTNSFYVSLVALVEVISIYHYKADLMLAR